MAKLKVTKKIDPKAGAKLVVAGVVGGAVAVAGVTAYRLNQVGRPVMKTFMGDKPGQ